MTCKHIPYVAKPVDKDYQSLGGTRTTPTWLHRLQPAARHRQLEREARRCAADGRAWIAKTTGFTGRR